MMVKIVLLDVAVAGVVVVVAAVAVAVVVPEVGTARNVLLGMVVAVEVVEVQIVFVS